MSKQVSIKENEIPEDWSEDAVDLINKLLQRKPGHRIGMRGAAEVKNHPWLKYYPWKELYEKKLESPFIPKLGDNFDKKYCESPDKMGTTTKGRYEKHVKDDNFQNAFKNFTIINLNNEESHQQKEKEQKEKEQKEKKEKKELNRENYSSAKTRPMHIRSSSVLNNPSSYNLNNNNNFHSTHRQKENNNLNNAMNNNINNNNVSNINNSQISANANINENILKSRAHHYDKEKRVPSSMNNTGVYNSNLKNQRNHKQTKSYNNIYGSLVQLNEKGGNNNNNNSNKKTLGLENTPDRITNSTLREYKSAVKPQGNGKLPNINNIDRLKIRKLINSNDSSLLFKYYKSNSIKDNSGYKSQILQKKNFDPTSSYSNFKQK